MLSIVVPFLNEEDAIEEVLRRCLAAGERLRAGPYGLDAVEVVAVDDGSTDSSAERAAAVPGVRLVRHAANAGYGAALKSGFAYARGQWLAFLDADGTCDPGSLEGLLGKALAERLDVATGARLHARSRMPALRAAGNRIFGAMLARLGARGVSDVASGIRVLRREAYERMAPLPDGMSFTPAMSARALLDPALRLGEVAVPYAERQGESKLCPVCDGALFTRAILENALVYRPRLLFGWAAAGLMALAAAFFCLSLGGPAAPLSHLLRGGGAEPWMYFRFILIAVCAALAVFLSALGLVLQSLVGLVHRGRDGRRVGPGPAAALARRFPVFGAASFAAGVLVNAQPLASYARTGRISSEYWTLPIVGAVLCGVGVQLWGLWVAARVAELLASRRDLR